MRLITFLQIRSSNHQQWC